MKIILVDYIGYSNADGKPVGHTLKVLREYSDMLSDSYSVEYAIPKAYVKGLKADLILELPYYSDTTLRGKNRRENIKTLLKSFINIRRVLIKSDADCVWFCNVDQFLFMYLGIWGSKGKKVVVTTFAKEYPKWYHNYFFIKSKNKVELFISSNKNFNERKVKHNEFYMPDYLYSDEIYLPYVSDSRCEKIICLGTMSRAKRIKDIVQVCNKINYSLEVYGFFYDTEYYEEISRIKGKNVIITNKYIEYSDYLKKMGQAKYCFFNYDEQAYANITSGVLLECIFMGCVPIANNYLLSKMGIEGIGYSNISEIADLKLDEIDTSLILSKNKKIIDERYERKMLEEQLLKRLSSL